MNQFNNIIASITALLLSTKIKFKDKTIFLSRYLLDMFKIILFKDQVKKVQFLNGKNFFYSGRHLNLLLDNINLHLKNYSPYYIKAKNVIDIGASFGTFSLMVHYLNPIATIYAFEPSYESFSLLSKNCQKIKQIKIINKALGPNKAKVNFYHDEDFPEGSQIRQNSKGISYIVDQISLDDFIKTKKLQNISLLKIDTEGYEKYVLQGATSTLSITEYVIIEVNNEKLSHLIDILIFFNDRCFTLVNFGAINRDPSIRKEIGSLDLIFKKKL